MAHRTLTKNYVSLGRAAEKAGFARNELIYISKYALLCPVARICRHHFEVGGATASIFAI